MLRCKKNEKMARRFFEKMSAYFLDKIIESETFDEKEVKYV